MTCLTDEVINLFFRENVSNEAQTNLNSYIVHWFELIFLQDKKPNMIS